MNEFKEQKTKKKRHPIRNFFSALFLIAVLFLASLFGDFFPGLSDFRDSLLEKQAYSVTEPEDSAKTMSTSADEIVIQEYSIYYMGEEITLTDLNAKLDELDATTVTISDYKGTAKQQTWQEVSLLLVEKGLAVNENIIN